jgi:alcohol dehydrogenase, propanol-preferring
VRAVRLHATGEELRLEDVPLPEPRGAEVRVRVGGCGVCHTDLHIIDGTQARVELPRTLGHEIAGWVDAARPAAGDVVIGESVVVFGGWGCGQCAECRAGAEQRCARSVAPGFQADGGYAEAVLVPHARHLVQLGSLDPLQAAPLADAGITPYRAVRRARRWLNAGSDVLVIGCGALGQFILQYLRLVPVEGAELAITVRERSAKRLERARTLGADALQLDGDAEPAHESMRVVFDLVGTDATLATAAAAVAPDGLIVLIGEAGGSVPFGFDRHAVESWLTTVAWGTHDDLREVVRLATVGALHWNVEAIPLADASAAHARLRDGDVDGRLVLVP